MLVFFGDITHSRKCAPSFRFKRTEDNSTLVLNMTFDVPTLALVTGCMSFMQLLAFAVVWSVNRRIPGLGYWTVCSLLTSGSLALILFRQIQDHSVLTKLLPTLLAWAGAAHFYLGAAAFQGRRATFKWLLITCIPCLAGYLWFGWGAREYWLRPLFYMTPLILFLGLGAHELFLERRPGLRIAARFTGCASILYAFAFVVRASMLSARQGDPEPFQNEALQILIFSITLLWLLSWTFAVVMMINQWQNLEKTVYHEAQLKAKEELSRTELELATAEKELAAERAQRQRSLLLRDLHDGLGGVTANLILLSSMGRGQETTAERQELMQHIEHLAVECNREVRLLMDVLQEGSTEWRQFLREFREYAKHLTAGHRITLHWRVTGKVPEQALTDLVANISFMRCLKEAVNNLARHAGALKAMIRIRFFNRCIGVTIRDDGIGLQKCSLAKSAGRGLPNMLRRCNELKGRLTHRGHPGTTLRFVIPLPLRLDAIAPPLNELAIDKGEHYRLNQ